MFFFSIRSKNGKMNFAVRLHLALFTFASSANGLKSCTDAPCHLDKKVLKFFILGDWGGVSRKPYYTKVQKHVAETLGRVAVEENTDFQLSVGDNFYPKGVKNEADPRFKETFDDVYDNPHLKNTPWYIMAGNHDHYGNVMGQIGYTAHSNRWVYPWLYYKISYELKDGTTIDVLVLDTVVLCEFGHKFGRGEPHTHSRIETHWKWIENQLNNSKADYIFVAGHNPVYSIGNHGPTKCLIDKLKPILEEYHVDAYFSGHDHNLQHLIMRDENITVHQIISGAGGFASRKLRHMNDVPHGSSIFHYPPDLIHNKTMPRSTKGGFVLVRVDKSRAEFIFYNGRKDIVHGFNVEPRSVSR